MTKKYAPVADVADRHKQYMAFGLLAAGIIYLVRAFEQIAPAGMVQAFEILQVTLAILTILCIAPMFIWKIRHRTAGEKIVYFSKDGYAAQALETAQRVSWVITFLVLAFLESMDQLRGEFPEDFFLQIVLAILLCTMSIVFLYKIWSEDSGDLEEREG